MSDMNKIKLRPRSREMVRARVHHNKQRSHVGAEGLPQSPTTVVAHSGQVCQLLFKTLRNKSKKTQKNKKHNQEESGVQVILHTSTCTSTALTNIPAITLWHGVL